MYAPFYLNRGSKWTHNLQKKKKKKKKKNGRILTRNVLLKINFQDEGHLDTSFWIYILAIENSFSLSSLVVTYICTMPS